MSEPGVPPPPPYHPPPPPPPMGAGPSACQKPQKEPPSTAPGVPPPPPYHPPPPPPPMGAGPTVSPNRTIMIVLAYIWILFIIPLVAEKDDPEVQWHAKHGLGRFLGSE